MGFSILSKEQQESEQALKEVIKESIMIENRVKQSIEELHGKYMLNIIGARDYVKMMRSHLDTIDGLAATRDSANNNIINIHKAAQALWNNQ